MTRYNGDRPAGRDEPLQRRACYALQPPSGPRYRRQREQALPPSAPFFIVVGGRANRCPAEAARERREEASAPHAQDRPRGPGRSEDLPEVQRPRLHAARRGEDDGVVRARPRARRAPGPRPAEGPLPLRRDDHHRGRGAEGLRQDALRSDLHGAGRGLEMRRLAPALSPGEGVPARRSRGERLDARRSVPPHRGAGGPVVRTAPAPRRREGDRARGRDHSPRAGEG